MYPCEGFTCRARVKWLVLVSLTMLVVMADWLPQRHCRYPIVFWSRWRAIIVEALGRTPREENCNPHCAVTKLRDTKFMRFTEIRNKSDLTHHTQMDTYHRAVTLRNTFIPNKGPLMSPAPNSSLRHTQTRTSEPDQHKTWRSVGMSFTSPQPLAEVTRRTQRFIFPPPLPLCVDRDPERTAVSEVVRGACQT